VSNFNACRRPHRRMLERPEDWRNWGHCPAVGRGAAAFDVSFWLCIWTSRSPQSTYEGEPGAAPKLRHVASCLASCWAAICSAVRQPPRQAIGASTTSTRNFKAMLNPRAYGPAGAGRVIAREHGCKHASLISREGVIFREPPDSAGARVQRARRAASRNHSARRRFSIS
jgi:hypothetical protein